MEKHFKHKSSLVAPQDEPRVAGLINKVQQQLSDGHATERLPNTLNVSFIGGSGAEILTRLEGVAASTGSACHEGTTELSPVLRAMGAIRFSLGRTSTNDEIEWVVEELRRIN